MTSQSLEITSFEALYTKQKTQKHKKWKDGSLHAEYKEGTAVSKSRVKLFDEDGLLILTTTLHSKSLVPGETLEVEQYLVQVLEPIDREVIISQQRKLCEDGDVMLGTEQSCCKKRKTTAANSDSGPLNSALDLTDKSMKTQVNYSGRSNEEIIHLLSE
ncbi:hypothetical protein Gasu2_29270 [Galdieria sulphuraria]|nr:hypothetical protein Gasu2_29270 [Galdieria sulphuraria]